MGQILARHRTWLKLVLLFADESLLIPAISPIDNQAWRLMLV